ILARLRRAYADPPPPRRLAPLDELILTVLSQNTNDVNRDRAYADLRSRFSTWDEAADGPRPPTARAMPLDERPFARMRAGDLWDLLVGLRGVGPKTAALVLLFSLGRPFFPVDTHVHRLTRRLGLVPENRGA